MVCMCIATLLTAVAHAQEINVVLEDTLTDSLTSQEDVRWYSFVMSERGDIELIIRGLQAQWDGWTNHWTVAVYAQDMQTVLVQKDARGYNTDYNPPAQISLLDLEAGTYYIRISAASTSHYTTDSYQLELSRTYSAVQSFVNSSDNNIYSMGDDAFLDRLTSEDQVRWYSFTMAEPGDAELVVAGQQEQWDGYIYHWVCTMYESDRETVIEQASVRGYSENTDPSVLSATGLAAGTYYVQMKSSSSTNPLMATFTAEPYKMQLFRSYTSAGTVSGDAGSTSNISDTVNDATGTVTATSLNVRGGPGTSYDVLGTLANGTVVTITGNSDGWYRIQYNGTDGWVSGQHVEIQTTNEEQVNTDISAGTVSGNAGSTSSISDTVNDATGTVTATSLNVRGGPGTSYDVLGTLANGTVVTITGNSDGWYRIQYNGTDGWVSGQHVEIQTTNEEQVNTDAGTDGQQEKLETSEDSNILDWIIKHKVATGIIIFIIICLLGGSSYSPETDGGSYSGGSESSGFNYSTSYFDGTSPTLTDKDHDDLDAVQRAIDISRRYGDDWKGYDPEAPGPDPESFPDSNDIW